MFTCQPQSPKSCHPPFSHHVYTSAHYVYISIPALQIDSSVPLLYIPHECLNIQLSNLWQLVAAVLEPNNRYPTVSFNEQHEILGQNVIRYFTDKLWSSHSKMIHLHHCPVLSADGYFVVIVIITYSTWEKQCGEEWLSELQTLHRWWTRWTLHDSFLNLGWRWGNSETEWNLCLFLDRSLVSSPHQGMDHFSKPRLVLSFLVLAMPTHIFAGEADLGSWIVVMIHTSQAFRLLPRTTHNLAVPVFHVKQNFSWRKPTERRPSASSLEQLFKAEPLSQMPSLGRRRN